MWKGPIIPFEKDDCHLIYECTCGVKYGLLSILQSHIALYEWMPDGKEHKAKEDYLMNETKKKVCPSCGNTTMMEVDGILTCTQCSLQRTEKKGKVIANDTREEKN